MITKKKKKYKLESRYFTTLQIFYARNSSNLSINFRVGSGVARHQRHRFACKQMTGRKRTQAALIPDLIRSDPIRSGSRVESSRFESVDNGPAINTERSLFSQHRWMGGGGSA
mgnify:CR=1 FL=1